MSYRHNALADAFITAQIFQIQLLKILKYGIKTIDKLFELIKGQREISTITFSNIYTF